MIVIRIVSVGEQLVANLSTIVDKRDDLVKKSDAASGSGTPTKADGKGDANGGGKDKTLDRKGRSSSGGGRQIGTCLPAIAIVS